MKEYLCQPRIKLLFEDHFSKHSGQYAQYRPHYPNEIYTYLASLTQDTPGGLHRQQPSAVGLAETL
jgi:hypothetical protein